MPRRSCAGTSSSSFSFSFGQTTVSIPAPSPEARSANRSRDTPGLRRAGRIGVELIPTLTQGEFYFDVELVDGPGMYRLPTKLTKVSDDLSMICAAESPQS